MLQKKKAASSAANLRNAGSKDTDSSRIIQQVRRLFLSGGTYTAKEINERVGFNDARKVISTLRKRDCWKIKDVRLDTGCKLYWLESDKRQLSIDWKRNADE